MNNLKNDTNCLLITSYMPPLRGGSAVVYENLLKYGNGHIFVLTAEKNCETNQLIPQASDYRKKYPNIFTLPLLRQQVIQCRNRLHSLFVLLCYEIPIKFRVILKVIELIKIKNINVICIGELYSLGWLANIIRLFFPHIKIVFYIHGEELTVTYNSYRYKNSGYKYLQQADNIVAVSSFTKNTLINEYNVEAEKITLITNGVDLNKFNNNAIIDKIENIELNKTDYILFVGRLIERKGVDNLIRAMADVITKYPKCKLLIAGKGDYEPVLKSLVNENALANTVIFLGAVSDVELNSLYQYCKIFTMPNRTLIDGDTEGFGLVFLEANAFGKPVIAGNAGGTPDAVIDGETGFLVNSESVNEIANAIIKTLAILVNDKLHFSQHCYDWAAKNDVKHKVQDFILSLIIE